jgi:crotonobetainyl-CoA:carnitine CoA-transferase CaiB-like acyl-CoA transferase
MMIRRMDPTNDSRAPLAGLTVLDASQMLAGPICAMRLGDLGANVVKIEPPGRGEHNRSHGIGGVRIGGETPTFLGLNRNKRSVALDLKQPAGLEALLDLVKVADVFVQNFRVGTAERLGVGWADLSALNPRLVYCQISGYGETGPYRDRPGQDLVVQGYSGSMWAVGAMDDPPSPGALWAVDVMTGYQAAIGILAALAGRERTGRGDKVSVSMLGTVLDCQAQELALFLNAGVAPERSTVPTAHALIPAPYGVFRTADGWLTLAMSPLPSLGDALDDDRLRAMTGENDGVIHRDRIQAIVAAALTAGSTADWLRRFEGLRLWAGPVHTYADLANDPHVAATGMIMHVEHPTAGTVRMVAPPISLANGEVTVRRPPPRLGEHTAEVLHDLAGYDEARIGALVSMGAAGALEEADDGPA